MCTMTTGRDVEYGRTPLLEKWERLNISPSQVKRFLFAIFVASLSVYIASFTSRIDESTVISLEERTYSPFKYSTKISSARLTSATFPQLHSHINRRLQISNLFEFAKHAREYLNETKSVCIHAKYFEVPYEMIITQAHIIVNPTFVSMSTNVLHEKVSDPLGHESWISYPETCTLRYLDGETLETINRDFRKLDSLCFHFYLHYTN
jgi:hypothetical protein